MKTKVNHISVLFQPSGKRGKFPAGSLILDCARSLGVDIDSVCGGRGICGRCKIRLLIGNDARVNIKSFSNSVSPISDAEKRYSQKKELINDERLSCHTKLLRSVIIDVPHESQVHKQVIRKRSNSRKIIVKPALKLYYVEVTKPDMKSESGDFERLIEALKTQWGISSSPRISLSVLQKLQKTLRKSDWKITVALQEDNKVICSWPGFHDVIYGIALDIGTTTIAAHLCNLHTGDVLTEEGIMNPQIRFGEDLMSRVAYIMMNKNSTAEVSSSVIKAINELTKRLRKNTNIKKKDILSYSIACNPIMHHLLLGIDPSELGTAPFALATNSSINLTASQLRLNQINLEAPVYILPCIAGHVGADASAVILSEAPYLSKKTTLIIDIGTNAEIILGNKERLLAASSPTGPAFEGAQISCGQRATPGAIEKIRIDPNTFEPRYRVIGSPLWSNENGFDSSVKDVGITGICGSGIIEAISEMYLVGLLNSDGSICGEKINRTSRIQKDGRTFRYIIDSRKIKIFISQQDVRAVQLAKAALYAGTKLLMNKMDIKKIDKIVLVGAFGSNIDAKYAMILGMIPDSDLSCVSAGGNAAGTGARIALLNIKSRSEIENVVKSIEKVEIAIEPLFQTYFIDAMAIPHKSASKSHLRKVVKLPNSQENPGNSLTLKRRLGKRRQNFDL